MSYFRDQDESFLFNKEDRLPTDYVDCNESLYQNALMELKKKYKECDE